MNYFSFGDNVIDASFKDLLRTMLKSS